jgi:CheY-like chemotaxis protein
MNKPTRVLIADDEPLVRRAIKRVLVRGGFDVHEARSGAEALILCEAEEEPFDLLVADVVMPEMSGRELAERFRVMSPSTKVIYMSAYSEPEVIANLALGPNAVFLPKAFTPTSLLSRVRSVLEAHEAG